MRLPVAALTGVTHERIGCPSRCTVQAPQSAMPQPNFVPVRPITSRSAQRSGMSGGTSTVWSLPLMLRVIMLGLVLRVACSLLHDEELERHFHCRDFWGRTCNVFMAARSVSRYPTQPD